MPCLDPLQLTHSRLLSDKDNSTHMTERQKYKTIKYKNAEKREISMGETSGSVDFIRPPLLTSLLWWQKLWWQKDKNTTAIKYRNTKTQWREKREILMSETSWFYQTTTPRFPLMMTDAQSPRWCYRHHEHSNLPQLLPKWAFGLTLSPLLVPSSFSGGTITLIQRRNLFLRETKVWPHSIVSGVPALVQQP